MKKNNQEKEDKDKNISHKSGNLTEGQERNRDACCESCTFEFRSIPLLGRLLCGASEFFFCFQVVSSFCPVKRGNRAGSSRNEFDHSRRGTETSFFVSRLSQLREFRTSSFSSFFLEKWSLSNRAPFLINCQFSHYTIEKWDRSERSGKLIWVPLRE